MWSLSKPVAILHQFINNNITKYTVRPCRGIHNVVYSRRKKMVAQTKKNLFYLYAKKSWINDYFLTNFISEFVL